MDNGLANSKAREIMNIVSEDEIIIRYEKVVDHINKMLEYGLL
jgi:hypothetical protein